MVKNPRAKNKQQTIKQYEHQHITARFKTSFYACYLLRKTMQGLLLAPLSKQARRPVSAASRRPSLVAFWLSHLASLLFTALPLEPRAVSGARHANFNGVLFFMPASWQAFDIIVSSFNSCDLEQR